METSPLPSPQPRCGAGLGRIVPNGTFPSAGAPPQRHSLPGREGARCVCRGHRAERREILRATPVRAPGCGERFGAGGGQQRMGQKEGEGIETSFFLLLFFFPLSQISIVKIDLSSTENAFLFPFFFFFLFLSHGPRHPLQPDN